VAGLVAVVASSIEATRIIPYLRALPRNMPHLLAVIAGGLVGTLEALLGDVPYPVAPVTPVMVLLAFPREVPEAVTLVAFLPATESASAASSATPITALRALPGEVSRPATFVTYIGAHPTNAPVFMDVILV
jgi:hypothetical protein